MRDTCARDAEAGGKTEKDGRGEEAERRQPDDWVGWPLRSSSTSFEMRGRRGEEMGRKRAAESERELGVTLTVGGWG